MVDVPGVLYAAMDTTLSFRGLPIARCVLPEIFAEADTDNIINLSAQVDIEDYAAFNVFGDELLRSPSVDITLTGMASVSTTIAGLSITIPQVPFSKTVAITGANGLAGASVTYFSLASTYMRRRQRSSGHVSDPNRPHNFPVVQTRMKPQQLRTCRSS